MKERRKNRHLFIEGAPIIIFYLCLALFGSLTVFLSARSYDQYIENPTESDNLKFEYETGGIIKASSVTTKNGITHIKYKVLKEGTETISTTLYHKPGEKDGTVHKLRLFD